MVDNDSIQLLKRALSVEYDEIIKYDQEDGIDVNSPDYKPDSIIEMCISTFEDYRKVRMEEAYFSKMPNELSISQRQQRIQDYDRKRRDFHNAALSCVNMLNRTLQIYHFEPIYKGPILTDEQIDKHTNLDARNAYTDFFLELLDQLENYSIDLTQEQDAQEQFAQTTLSSMGRTIRRDSRGFGLKTPFLKDDGNIVFDDEDAR